MVCVHREFFVSDLFLIAFDFVETNMIFGTMVGFRVEPCFFVLTFREGFAFVATASGGSVRRRRRGFRAFHGEDGTVHVRNAC